MNITVEREASFEVSKQNRKRIEDEPIFASDPFPSFDGQADFLPKHDDAKVTNDISPTKVMDFVDGFSDAQFSTPTTDNNRKKSESFDPWEDICESNEFELEQQPESKQHDFSGEAPNKILFPDDHEPKENIAREDDDINILDDEGFPKTSFTPDLVSSIKERYQQQKTSRNVHFTPEDSSATGDQQSVRSRSTNWKSCSGRKIQTLIAANWASLPSFGADNQSGSPTDSNVSNVNNKNGADDDGEKNKEINSSTKEEPSSHWERLMAKLPEGERVKANILLVRRKIMACQEPGSVVIFDDGVDPSSVGSDPSKNNDHNLEGTKTRSNESVFSLKSVQQFSATVLSTSQDMLSIPSDASTPIRTQTKRKPVPDPSRSNPADFIFPQFNNDNDKSSNCMLKLCIDLYEESAFQTLMSNLEGNAEVKEIHVFRSWDGKMERTRTTADIGLLFKTIRSLSNLSMLNLANFLVEEIQFVALSQWQNKNLHTIRIHLCKGALSKRLLYVLATLPALKDLTLEMAHSFPLHILLSSQTLESLTIVANDYTIDNLHAMEMVQKLPKNETLKKLTIEPAFCLRTFKLLLSALSKNIGIEYLQFSLLPGNQADTNRAISELARTLMSNASLKSIRNLNHSKVKVNERTCDAVMKSLSENYIIEEFLVFNEEPWFRDRKITILKENKMEYESLFPQIPQMFNCGNKNTSSVIVDDSVNVSDDSQSVAQSVAHSVSASLVSIGDNVKSQAERVTSGALDYVGETVGLKKCVVEKVGLKK
jgi:hypothetical protein